MSAPESQPDPSASPLNGQVPPVEHRWPKGTSGNPKGRPPAGASIQEWINVLAEEQLTKVQLQAMLKDPSLPWPKATAVLRILRNLENPDLADFAGLLRGENDLEGLRAIGIDTAAVKKFKQKTRKVPVGKDEVEEVIEREIELHDRSGEEFDRVMDRTLGKPHQSIALDANHNVTLDPVVLTHTAPPPKPPNA